MRRWNRLASGINLSQVKNSAQAVLLYDDGPHDGTRIVGFLDGHVVRMREEQFAELVKAKAIQ